MPRLWGFGRRMVIRCEEVSVAACTNHLVRYPSILPLILHLVIQYCGCSVCLFLYEKWYPSLHLDSDAVVDEMLGRVVA